MVSLASELVRSESSSMSTDLVSLLRDNAIWSAVVLLVCLDLTTKPCAPLLLPILYDTQLLVSVDFMRLAVE